MGWLGTIQTPPFLSLSHWRTHPIIISSRDIHNGWRENLSLGRRFSLIGTSIPLSFLLIGSTVVTTVATVAVATVATVATTRREVVRRLGWSVRFALRTRLATGRRRSQRRRGSRILLAPRANIASYLLRFFLTNPHTGAVVPFVAHIAPYHKYVHCWIVGSFAEAI